MTTVVRDFVANQYAWFSESVWPPVVELWERLDVPEYGLYKDAVQTCVRDSWEASQSTFTVIQLTFRPILILLWIILKFLWRNLLEHGGKSLQKGARQLKVALVAFYKFQLSLTPTEVLGEVAILGFFVGLYYFQKWLRRQTYWSRTVRWYRDKKAKCVQVCTKFVYKVAEVSKVLAMSLPHLVFLGWCVAVRIFFPSLVRWVAHDTYFRAILSVGYPLLSSLMWVHASRHPYHSQGTAETELTKEKDNKDTAATHNATKDTKTTSTGSLRKRKPSSKNQITSSTKTENARSSLSSTQNRASSTSTGHKSNVGATPDAAVGYWLRYWHTYAMVQAFGQFCTMIPIFGRIVTWYPFFSLLAGEMKLLFFVWLFGMEYMLYNTPKDTFMAQAMPCNLIKRFITPMMLAIHDMISEVVSHDRWGKWVMSYASNVLGGFVFIKMVSEETKDWVLHVLQEARVVIAPAITLLMPGFITSFGVAYVQYIVPSAKSAKAKGNENKLVYLQYWILNCALCGLLSWFAGILWWIPFSNHIIFILWAYLSFPQTIRKYYDVLESELIAFGILKGDTVDLNDTKTAKLFQAVVSRLPSGVDNQATNESNIAIRSIGSEDAVLEVGSKRSDSNHQEDVSSSPSTETKPTKSSSRLHAKIE
ncbi:hypothetical protein IV203_022435 [Nitzschia inconspicua]|uniref:Uncharacterized protein n=1 Tax=Nitzschia inconspicua TaxID=303405 RepID=A0A9K3K767_9STRA|nr:hypothetical protein IV203_024594 [Nitzschia inconspicua]KAG7344427.1 hypothetical protein IV203_022435 [Nitzschia inconspicua]